MSLTQQGSTFERLERYKATWLDQQGNGRPTLASPEIANEIVKHLAAGNYLKPSCEAAGISYEAMRQWIVKAAEDRRNGEDSPYVKFVDALTRATSSSETALVSRLNAAEDWRAQAFLLERRHRDRWGKAEAAQQATQVLVISDQLAAGVIEALRIATAAQPVAQPALEAEFSQVPDILDENGK